MPPSPPSRISLLLSDVDGTLVTPDKSLTPGTVAAVGRLRAAGIAFAVTSSRPPAGLAALIEPLNLTTALAGFNGGMIVDRVGNVIRQLTLSPEAVLRAVALLEVAGVDIWVFAGNTWLVTNPNGAYVPHERHTLGYPPEWVANFEPHLGQVTKIVASSPEPDRLRRAERDLRPALADQAVVAMSQSYYLDITPPRADKGHALLALSELLLISPREIAVIGDGENDIAMFERAGLSIAMGNAAAEVQAAADIVTGRNTEDGFAQAVDQFILPRAASIAHRS